MPTITTPEQDMVIAVLLLAAFFGVVWLFIRDEFLEMLEEWKQSRRS